MSQTATFVERSFPSSSIDAATGFPVANSGAQYQHPMTPPITPPKCGDKRSQPDDGYESDDNFDYDASTYHAMPKRKAPRIGFTHLSPKTRRPASPNDRSNVRLEYEQSPCDDRHYDADDEISGHIHSGSEEHCVHCAKKSAQSRSDGRPRFKDSMMVRYSGYRSGFYRERHDRAWDKAQKYLSGALHKPRSRLSIDSKYRDSMIVRPRIGAYDLGYGRTWRRTQKQLSGALQKPDSRLPDSTALRYDSMNQVKRTPRPAEVTAPSIDPKYHDSMIVRYAASRSESYNLGYGRTWEKIQNHYSDAMQRAEGGLPGSSASQANSISRVEQVFPTVEVIAPLVEDIVMPSIETIESPVAIENPGLETALRSNEQQQQDLQDRHTNEEGKLEITPQAHGLDAKEVSARLRGGVGSQDEVNSADRPVEFLRRRLTENEVKKGLLEQRSSERRIPTRYDERIKKMRRGEDPSRKSWCGCKHSSECTCGKRAKLAHRGANKGRRNSWALSPAQSEQIDLRIEKVIKEREEEAKLELEMDDKEKVKTEIERQEAEKEEAETRSTDGPENTL